MTTDIRRGWTSASSAAQDLACPGRHQAQQGISEIKGDDAKSGQAIHDALKAGDSTKLTIDQRDVYDACKAIEQKLVQAVFGANAKVVEWRERRFWCNVIALGEDGKSLGQFQHSGQADLVCRAGSKLLIIDYKTLQGDVEDSPKNLQLRDLSVLASGELGLVSEVATSIVQPLVTHSPEVCLYEADDLKRAEQEMFARVAASNALNAPRVAGELQCKYCLAKTKCPQFIAWAGAMIPTGPIEPVVKELVFQTAMELWTPQQRAIAANLLSPAAKALDEIKDFLKAGLAKDPNFIPGWTLSEGTKREVINDPQACFNRFSQHGGQLEQFMGCVSVGKTKLKEALAAVTGDKGRALDTKLAKMIEGIIEVSMTAGSLKKVDK